MPELRDVLDRLGEAQIAVAAVKAAEAGGKDLSPSEKKAIGKAAVEATKQSGQLRPPDAVTLAMVMDAIRPTGGDLCDWLKERKNRRAIPHRFESCGYVPVRNSSAESGLWVIAGKRQVVYGRKDVPPAERIAAAEAIKAAEAAEDLKAAELKKKFGAGIAEL